MLPVSLLSRASVRVPGKLVLAGEYAVLEPGEPAVVAAVDRYALAERQEGEVVVDTAAFHDPATGRKLGLGSSSAVAVARAAFAHPGATPSELLRAAREEHERMGQQGGSGVDLAAACCGGVLLYRQGAEPERLPVPGGLELVVGWTGDEARTGELAPRVRSALASRPDEAAAFRRLSRTGVEWLVRGLREADPDLVALGVSGGLAALRYLAEVTEVPILVPALDRLVEAAGRIGVPAKPSGAGGGDCGIALVFGAGRAEEVRRAWREVGIVPLDVAISAAGVS